LILVPVGVVAAAASGYACIRFMMTYLQRHAVDVFVYYRWGLALLIAAVALMAITTHR
jgi:undecaprenyl pyrophosphate phosphatase UppP